MLIKFRQLNDFTKRGCEYTNFDVNGVIRIVSLDYGRDELVDIARDAVGRPLSNEEGSWAFNIPDHLDSNKETSREFPDHVWDDFRGRCYCIKCLGDATGCDPEWVAKQVHTLKSECLDAVRQMLFKQVQMDYKKARVFFQKEQGHQWAVVESARGRSWRRWTGLMDSLTDSSGALGEWIVQAPEYALKQGLVY